MVIMTCRRTVPFIEDQRSSLRSSSGVTTTIGSVGRTEVNGLLRETHREGNLQLFDVTEPEVEEEEGNRAGMLTLS